MRFGDGVFVTLCLSLVGPTSCYSGGAVDLHALVERLAPGARVERSWPLTGGVSAVVVAVSFTRGDGVRERVVVRRQAGHDWKAGADGGVAPQYELLVELHAQGLPVARPRLCASPDILVLDFVDGATDLPPDPGGAMADVLARIHAAGLASLPTLPAREDPLPALLERFPDAPGLAAALSGRGPWRGPAALLHGDFWPGNLLWREGEIVAVLDWEDAAVGDPLSDLACARVELECAAGEAVARAFTEHYLRRTGLDAARLPMWDLYVSTAALDSMDRWGLAPDVLAARRAATAACQDQARAALGVPSFIGS